MVLENIKVVINKKNKVYDNHGCAWADEYTGNVCINNLTFPVSYNNFGSFRIDYPTQIDWKKAKQKGIIVSLPNDLIHNFDKAVKYMLENNDDVQDFICSYLKKENLE